ncbi:alpha/beta hydrolase [Actinomadura scrupuli]|uniref:alpha/beta hydrolase n=1 Tax=Actinomadura scrupuli TaxID=559629 RepID=UPI003D99CA02
MRKVLALGMTLAVAGTTTVAAAEAATAATGRTSVTARPATPATPATPPAPWVPEVVAPASTADLPLPVRQQTYAYGSDPRQRLDAYWTTPLAGRQPGVLLLHGGYWLTGDKGSWKNFARRLSARGYAVFAANYRLSPQRHWPAQRDDSSAALTYIKRNASRYHLDPDRIVVVGASAGGQLAAMLGTYGAGRKNVRGVVALSPVNSPYLAYLDGARPAARASQRRLRTAVTQLIGCTPRPQGAACWDRLQDVTPVDHVDGGDAPMLLMHSAGDFVPYEQSVALRDVLTAVRVPATLVRVPGSAHGAGLLADPQVAATVVNWVYSVTRR